MTTLAAASAVGDTNVKVASVTNLVAGQPIFVDTGLNLETGAIAAVGTAGAAGTGVTLTAPLKLAHASGARFHVNEGQPVGFTGDTVEHLNFFASGAPHGVDDESDPTEELLRALELPATYTALLVSSSNYLGAVPKPTGTVAYFETDPVNPTSTLTVNFDAGFSRTSDGGQAGLQYYWDFGDGTHGVGKTVSHTYAASQWADVKLVVAKGDSSLWGMYRQAVAVNSPSGAATLDSGVRDVLRGRAGAADQGREGCSETQAQSPCERDGKAMNAHGGESKMRRAVRKIIRPRWLALLALTAVAIPAALVASTAASSADGIPVSNPAHPVVDANWIYDHDCYDRNTFIYKVAGSDGCLPTATTCGSGGGTAGDANNLPQNYNGAQEFYKWWKGVGTTRHAAAERQARLLDHGQRPPLPDEKLADQRRRAHDPRRRLRRPAGHAREPQRLDAGQRARTRPRALTPMSGMHSGNWGNGSGYDANMGENMNLEEIGSVLRWHEVNGTYPARTIKATLYDNEEGGLVGSGDYSAAGGGATLLQAPVSPGATNIKVAAVTQPSTQSGTHRHLRGRAAGGDRSTGTRRNAVVQSIGTAARTATTLPQLPPSATRTSRSQASTNMVVGETVRLEALQNREPGVRNDPDRRHRRRDRDRASP